MTWAFSDVARTGTTGTCHYLTAVTGGKIDARGLTIKNMDNTAARPLTLVELDDDTEGSSFDVAMPSGGDVDELTALTNTVTQNTGVLRLGNTIGTAALPRVLSLRRTHSATTGNITIDASLSGNNREVTATGNITFLAPTGGIFAQVLQVEVLASGGSRTITIDSGIQRLTGVTATYTVPSGKLLRLALRYSALANAWVAESAAVTL
jgi:hypothetical protein